MDCLRTIKCTFKASISKYVIAVLPLSVRQEANNVVEE